MNAPHHSFLKAAGLQTLPEVNISFSSTHWSLSLKPNFMVLTPAWANYQPAPSVDSKHITHPHCKPKSGWNSPTQGEKEIIHPVDRWIQSGWKGWEFPVPYFTHSMDEFHKQFLFWLGGISSLLGTHTEDQIQPADRWNRTDILMVLLSCWMLLAYIG